MTQVTTRYVRLGVGALLALLGCLFLISPAAAQMPGIPAFSINEGDGGSTYSLSLQILALMTALTMLPSLVLGMTSFTRIIIVLSILRQAMGTQSHTVSVSRVPIQTRGKTKSRQNA